MTERELLKLALEALEEANSCVDGYYIPKGKTQLPVVESAIAAIKEALAQPEQCKKEQRGNGEYVCNCKPDKCPELAQPEQEPVRVMGFNCVCGRRMEVSAEQGVTPAPQRTWVGLTFDDLDEIDAPLRERGHATVAEIYRAIEAKLKEKNT